MLKKLLQKLLVIAFFLLLGLVFAPKALAGGCSYVSSCDDCTVGGLTCEYGGYPYKYCVPKLIYDPSGPGDCCIGCHVGDSSCGIAAYPAYDGACSDGVCSPTNAGGCKCTIAVTGSTGEKQRSMGIDR